MTDKHTDRHTKVTVQNAEKKKEKKKYPADTHAHTHAHKWWFQQRNNAGLPVWGRIHPERDVLFSEHPPPHTTPPTPTNKHTHLNAQAPTHTIHISKSIDNTPQIINKFSVCPAFR